MITDQTMQLGDAIEEAKGGADLLIRCLAHTDGTASLHVSPGRDGKVALRCFADCTTADILAAADIGWSELFPPREVTTVSEDVWTPNGPASHIYPYVDERGTLLYQVLRVPQGDRKTFMQRTPNLAADRDSRPWLWKLDGIQRVLYRLPQILSAVKDGQTIYICEGEKDADTLVARGLQATTVSQGAALGNWKPEFSNWLAGSNVVICADNDDKGRAYARTVREALLEVGCSVEIREARPPAKDVTDHIHAGGTVASMLVTVKADDSKRAKFGIDILDVILRRPEDTQFVIPGTLARRERLLITGFEGLGKSNLCRWISACCAGGIHPFTTKPIPPQQVLQIDAENEPGQVLESWQSMVQMVEFLGGKIEPGLLTVLEEWDNADMDLASPTGTEWLHERITAYEPDLVVMGPLTNMVGRDLKDDEPVRRLKSAVNSARSICGSAFIMEHHAPHKSGNEKSRSVRPYGSSMFLRWPDYGFGLLPQEQEGVFEWKRTRWPRVRSRQWPAALRWGNAELGEGPWVETVLEMER